MARTIVAFLLAIIILSIASFIAMTAATAFQLLEGNKWVIPVFTHSIMLILSFVAILILSKGRIGDYGFARPDGMQFWKVVLFSLPISLAAGVILKLLPQSGNPLEGVFTVPQVILFVWIYASICEETFTRGLIQGFLSPLSRHRVKIRGLELSLPVLVGAGIFGLMHVPLLQAGMGPWPVSVIVLFAFLLGIIAGYHREKTGSLVPAVIVHLLFNVGGSMVAWLIP